MAGILRRAACSSASIALYRGSRTRRAEVSDDGPGLARLEEELRTLKSQERPAIIRAIAEARSHGDLSENAEYHAARERQSFIEGRIQELEEIVGAVEVIDPSSLSAFQHQVRRPRQARR